MTSRPQLKTGIWIDALIRRAQSAGAFACVLRSGDRDAGTVLLVVRSGDGLTLYSPERDMEGARVWRAETLTDEEELDRRVDARLSFDTDLNLVEVEDRQGRHFIDEPVIAAVPEAEAAALAVAKAVFRDQ